MNDNINDYLKQSLAGTIGEFIAPLLPPRSKWLGGSEEDAIWISVFRVFKVPYDTQTVSIRRVALGQIRGVFSNANLPYPNIAYGFDPQPDGSVVPRGGLLGWDATSRGNLLVLMTPVRSDDESIEPETAVRYRVDSARAVIVGILGLNAAFEQICEFEFRVGEDRRGTISRRGPAMENPAFYDAPPIHDAPSWELIRTILEGIDSLEASAQNRVRLALRWYQRALGDRRVHKVGGENVDALINHWIALETLVRVGEQGIVGMLIKNLSNIHGLSTQEIGQKFPINKVYQRRKEIVHQGRLSLGVSFELQQFLSDVFMDILALQTMKLSGYLPRTQKYLDGRANDYL